MHERRRVSIIVRTYNEEQHISDLIAAIHAQEFDGQIEILVVDSESTDRTVELARAFENVTVVSIPKASFSYGYALNKGLQQARGNIAISISAHCIPVGKDWLNVLIAPLSELGIAITYGRQIGTLTSRLSERRVFEKNFPHRPARNYKAINNHNANSAFLLDVWRECNFDEKLRGLEDLDFALKASRKGLQCVYVPEAVVFHFHLETNEKVFNRYYRETLALKAINPSEHIGEVALLVDLVMALLGDYCVAIKESRIRKVFFGVLGYRLSQYFGIYTAYHGFLETGIKYIIQEWVLRKISHGTSDRVCLKQEGFLKRAA